MSWRGPGAEVPWLLLSQFFRAVSCSTQAFSEGRGGVCPQHTGLKPWKESAITLSPWVAGLEMFPSPFTDASGSVCILGEEFWALL